LRAIEADAPLWLVDPLDGTKNFVRGEDGFGIMVAHVVGGVTAAAWVVLPARGETFVAERGGGARRDGKAVRVGAPAWEGLPRGTAHGRYMPPALEEAVSAALGGRMTPIADAGCAAVEYSEVVKGERELSVYYRLLPWDHAAPALVLTEAGGRVEHAGGAAYGPRSRDQITIVARDAAMAREARAWLGAESGD
jgi:fructose-1,6-bisphosphatase/inositol monophosphatase family enzyme